jgi:hypothetical protein
MSGRLAAVALVGVAWQACFLALYVAAHNPLDAYLLYVPLAGFALLVAAVVEGAWRVPMATLRSPWDPESSDHGCGTIAACSTTSSGSCRPSSA